MSESPLKTLSEIRDASTEMDGIATALDLLMENVGDSKGFRQACFTLASLLKDRCTEVSRALDEYTTHHPD